MNNFPTIRKMLVVGSLAALCGCRGSTEPIPWVGDYSLQTMDGKALPQISAQFSNGYQTIDSGTLALRADESFGIVLNYSNHSGSQNVASVLHIDGTYNESGKNTLLLTTTNLTSNTTYQMTRSGSQIDWSLNGVLFRFQR